MPRDGLTEKLQALVRIPTVSHADPADIDVAAFDRFLEQLEEEFPLLHERLDLTRIEAHGLLFHWRGSPGRCRASTSCGCRSR